MVSSPLTRTHVTPDGARVRVRLARLGDLPAVAALLAGRGVAATHLDLRRLLQYDPVHRAVLVATAPVDGAERVVAIGSIDLDDGEFPDTLVVDERFSDGLGELLGDVLADRAARHHRRVA